MIPLGAAQIPFQGVTDQEQPLEVFLCAYNGTSVNIFLPQ